MNEDAGVNQRHSVQLQEFTVSQVHFCLFQPKGQQRKTFPNSSHLCSQLALASPLVCHTAVCMYVCYVSGHRSGRLRPLGDELMERYQLRPGPGVTRADRYLRPCGWWLTAARVKCVSRSACRVVHDPLVLFSIFPPRLHQPSPTARPQALSDFCSDPNTFVLNSTQLNTATSSGTVCVCPWCSVLD